jgi:glucosamine-6-phosphate deaminase
MNIIITKSYDELSKKAANFISSQVILNSKSVLGLATGETPIMTYKYIIEKVNEDEVDFENVISFNLDEYVGLGKEDIQSYGYFMEKNLFSKINIKKGNINIPNGLSKNIDKECKLYEEKIKNKGGIDLQLLGLGRNGHIGFNEPNAKFERITHKVKLDKNTIEANSRFFDSISGVPTEAISMGIKTIMKSSKILLLACGKNKAKAVKGLIEGSITPALPASILQLHRDVTVIIDEEAASLLDKR